MVSLPSPPSDVSPTVWRQALDWAQANALGPLPPEVLGRVAQGRLKDQVRWPLRLGCHTVERDGRRVMFALLGREVYAIEEGVIWGFSLTWTQSKRWRTARTVESLVWRAYLDHRARPDLHAFTLEWALGLCEHRSNPYRRSQWLQQVAAWVEDDIKTVFAEAGDVPYRHQHDLDEVDDKNEQARKAARKHHLQRMHEVLRAVRRALPRPVRQALWGNRNKALPRADLAHWLMKDGPEAVTYRSQALAQQPHLLPLALQAGGQWPVHFSSPAERHRQQLQPQLDRGTALTQAIDAGRPWEAQMVTLLQQGQVEAWLLHGHGQWQRYNLSHEGMRITEPLARQWKHATQHRLPPLSKMKLYAPQALEAWGHAWAALSQPRRPRSAVADQRFCSFLNHLGMLLVFHEPSLHEFKRDLAPSVWVSRHLDPFMKGLPEDWIDPRYDHLLARWPSLLDTLKWMAVPVDNRSMPPIGALMARLTWQQWDNFVDRAHAHQRRLKPVYMPTSEEGPLTWPGGRRVPVWQDGEVCIHELLDEAALAEEGEAMLHCIAGSGMSCAGGDTREFSVRRTDGTRLSTLEVVWEKEGPVNHQHVRADNLSPPEQAVIAVERFLADAAGWWPGPWLATPEHTSRMAALAADRARHEAYQRELSRQLWADLDRRYPLHERPSTPASPRQATGG